MADGKKRGCEGRSRASLWVSTPIVLALAILYVVSARAQTQNPAQTVLSEQVDLPRLVDLCAQRLKLNIQYDASSLQGSLTLRLGAGISDENLWVLTNRLLASRGFTTVQMAGEQSLNIVKITEAAAVARVEEADLKGAVAGFVKVILPLEHRAPEDLVAPIKQVLSPVGGTVSAVGKSTLLSLSDLRPNLEQALAVLKLLDVEAATTLDEVSLHHLDAATLIALVDSAASARAAVTGQPLTGKLIASHRTKNVFLVAPHSEERVWRELIERFDQRDGSETVSYKPAKNYPLKEVAKILEELAKEPGAATAGDRWQLIIDELTGTLIVTATPGQHEKIGGFVERLAETGGSDALISEVPARNVEAARLATLVEKIAVTRAQVSGKTLQGKVLPSPGGTSLLIVSPPEEETWWRELITRLDQREAVETITYSPKHFPLREVAKLIEDVTRERALTSSQIDRWKMITDELTGTLIVTATPSQHQRIADLITRLEAAAPATRRPMRSFVIRNRNAGELVELLKELIGAGFLSDGAPKNFSDDSDGRDLQVSPRPVQPLSPATADARVRRSRASGRDQEEGVANGAADLNDEILLSADEGTNTLIAVGEAAFLDQVGDLIQKLDVRQAQVMLEVLVASMTDQQALDLSVELQKRFKWDDALIGLSSLFGAGSPSLDGTLPGGGSGFTGVVLDPGSYAVLIRALETLNQGRSLTLPKVLVNNNEQARLDSVLQTPFASTNASTTVATTSFGGTQDAGTTVSLQPQIAEGDHLVLQYTVSLSSFVGESSTPELPPPRQQNNLQSRVTIPDGYTVVLGGLEIQSHAEAIAQVPLLGDIPLIGELFKSRGINNGKTRFFVFIRANILRGEDFSDLKYVSDREVQESAVDDGWPEVEPKVIH